MVWVVGVNSVDLNGHFDAYGLSPELFLSPPVDGFRKQSTTSKENNGAKRVHPTSVVARKAGKHDPRDLQVPVDETASLYVCASLCTFLRPCVCLPSSV